ncbi:hypothetical protein D3I60_04465 [Brevibacterium permense]|uniref:hypothetical protein n=1 Tax=Brevibacterium permense TaxID=234834 RepID=UPI0021D008D3|nr:hypothetical protein [Brevibacterium permense]MCU4296340.1 hypothetical protein [Brevibacterium permense]
MIQTNPYAENFTPIVELADGWLACRVCGVATAPTVQHGQDTITSWGREYRGNSPTLQRQAAQEFETTMTRCTTCEERREQAVAVNIEHPTGRGQYLADAIANTAVERALAVAAVAETDLKLTSARRVRLAIRHLTPEALGLVWESRFAPVAEAEAKEDSGAALPWAHVPEERRAEARRAVASYLRALTERPQPITAPTGGGCYLCGVASVEALPSRASRVWAEARVSPSSLGGTSTAHLSVSVCRTCADAAEAYGAYGQSMMARLVLEAAGISRKLGIENVRLDPPAWGVLDIEPNPTPWAHIDLADLREKFESGRIGR